MTDLIVAQNNLPVSIEDLSKFVLVGRDKLQAVRAMSALNNLNLTKEVREQKLREGQEIGKLVLLAEARLGEIFNRMPKQQGARTDLIVAQNNLPVSIEDLSKFVLVGRDKLQAVRASKSSPTIPTPFKRLSTTRKLTTKLLLALRHSIISKPTRRKFLFNKTPAITNATLQKNISTPHGKF